MEVDEIAQIIEGAFADRPYPGDSAIAAAVTTYRDEHTYVDEYFKGKHWKAVNLDGLKTGYAGPPAACLSFMSGPAFRFFLPAFMLIAVRRYKDADLVASSAINALMPPEGDLSTSWEERVRGFTPAQEDAIIMFLEFMDRQHGDDFPLSGLSGLKGLQEYWKTRRGTR